MKRLRDLSPRPTIVVDERNHRIVDPDAASVGVQGPFGRERCLYALPIGGVGPQQHAAALVVKDEDCHLIADANSNVVGVRNALWINRLLYARWVEDTRRLAG